VSDKTAERITPTLTAFTSITFGPSAPESNGELNPYLTEAELD